ncbi:NnrS family protein [Maritimibacter dapengensis]|nr:NnrS family protein [Maritimibacter dapengensis]
MIGRTMLSQPFARQSLPWWRVVEDEGFRLFFPLAALHAALWPFLWVVVLAMDLPFADPIPASLWHASEMILGSWGAVLIGFMTTSAPEWTDTPRLRGMSLWRIAILWGTARVMGLIAWDTLLWVSLVCDLAWMGTLIYYLIHTSIARRTDRLLPFIGWITALTSSAAVARFSMAVGKVELAEEAIVLTGLIFMGILGLAIGRISVPVANHVLDPTEESVPFRPHPGKLNLSPGLVAVALIGELLGLSGPVTGWLWIAAGAAFVDRMTEGFIGRTAFRTEILGLMASAGFAGAGLIALGASRLGAPWGEVPTYHLAIMGGIGFGVISVFAIAGKFHTGQRLGQGWMTRGAYLCIGAGVALRAAPAMGLMPWPPGPPHMLASLVWAAGFTLWLIDYLPTLTDPKTLDAEQIC